MSVLSGKHGTLNLAGSTVAPITNWKIELVCQAKDYVANDTHGVKRRLAGPEDCRGSFDCRLTEQGRCPVRRGQELVAQFHVDRSGENYYEVPIFIDEIGVDCDINQGGVRAFAVRYSGSGLLVAHGVLA